MTVVAADTDAAGASPVPRGRGRRERARAERRRLAVVGLILVGAIGFLLYKALTSAIVYFKTADEALAARASLGNSTFQLEGTVVPCTLRHTGPGTLDFTVSSGPACVRVESTGTPPQLFKANDAVVLVGHFVGSTNTFSSGQILVKHSNSYVAAHPDRVRPGHASTSCVGTS